MSQPNDISGKRPLSVRITDPVPQDDLEKLSDPLIVERFGRQRKEKETSRLLEILDSLERGKA